MADVMERSLATSANTDPVPLTTAPAAAIPSVPPLSTATASVEFQPVPSQPLGPSTGNALQPSESASPMKILEQVIDIISAEDSLFKLTDDELLAASLFFTNASEETVRIAHTFIALGNNRSVQHRFLLRQLEMAALLPGKGKGKAVEDDHSMVY
jgi:hypothetical protein